jgi:single-strand DNA-binding protein
MNNITVAGTLGRDAELKTTNSGDSILNFSVADSVNRDKTIWWNCQLWGKRANSLADYMKKGQSVTVSGPVSENEWTDKDGVIRKTLQIRVNDVALQGGRREAEPERQAAPERRAAPKPALDEDEIPF